MKITLINPGMDLSKFGAYSRFMQPMPPIGLAYIAAILKQDGADVGVIDNFVEGLNADKILDKIKTSRPDIVGISCLTPSAPIVFGLARAIKGFDKNIKIILGNVHASVFADSILKKEAVDIIVRGEADVTIRYLIRAIKSGSGLDDVAGISFAADGNIVHNPDRPIVSALDALPYPAWELFPYKSYGFLPFMDISKPGLSMLSSRGCPHKCNFCSLLEMSGTYRKRNPISVVDEYEYLVDKYSIKQIGFVDPAFAVVKADALKICDEIIKRKLNKKVAWICETRVDLMDKEILSAMSEAGCRRILYGIESGSEDSLHNANKTFTKGRVAETIKLTKASGIESSGLFMIGFPGETRQMVRQTIEFSKKLNLDFAKFAITVPYPGSRLYKDLTADGSLNRSDWENYVTFNPDPEKLVSISGVIEPKELIKLQQQAHREFYFQPKIIFKQLFKLRYVKPKDLFLGAWAMLSHGKKYA